MAGHCSPDAWHRWLIGLEPVMPSATTGEMLLALADARQVIRNLQDQLRAAEVIGQPGGPSCNPLPTTLAGLDSRVIPGAGRTIGASESRSARGPIALGSSSRSGAERLGDGCDELSRGGLSTRRSPRND